MLGCCVSWGTGWQRLYLPWQSQGCKRCSLPSTGCRHGWFLFSVISWLWFVEGRLESGLRFCRDGSQEVLFIDHKVKSQWGASHIGCAAWDGLVYLSTYSPQQTQTSKDSFKFCIFPTKVSDCLGKNSCTSFETFLALRDSSCFQPARAIAPHCCSTARCFYLRLWFWCWFWLSFQVGSTSEFKCGITQKLARIYLS